MPVRDEVRGACELLGLDPLHIANEGQFLAVVAAEHADARARGAAGGARRQRRRHRSARCASEPAAAVLVTTRYGGSADRRHAGRAIRCRGSADAARPTDLADPRSRTGLLAPQPALRAILRPGGAAPRRRRAARCRSGSSRGGRLLAFGRGPYATDAQHVSVEFVHPVIVGKRALPALDLSMLFGPWLEALVRPGGHGRWASARPSGDPEVRGRARPRPRRGAMTFALARRRRATMPVEAADRRPVRPPGADRDPVSHALGDGARLLRAPGAGPRRRRRPGFSIRFSASEKQDDGRPGRARSPRRSA